jgi:hypothetical protein
MDIDNLLHENLHAAMRDHDDLQKRVVRLLMSSIKLAEVNKGSKLDENEFIAVVQKEIKTRKDTILDAQKASREDLISEAREEILALEDYLPKQLTEDELVNLTRSVIQETGASSPKDMGKVLKILIPKLAGRATNQDASRVVKFCLENQA